MGSSVGGTRFLVLPVSLPWLSWEKALKTCHDAEGLRQNASHQPVLKHGPRSLTCVRVFGIESPARNESKVPLGMR